MKNKKIFLKLFIAILFFSGIVNFFSLIARADYAATVSYACSGGQTPDGNHKCNYAATLSGGVNVNKPIYTRPGAYAADILSLSSVDSVCVGDDCSGRYNLSLAGYIASSPGTYGGSYSCNPGDTLSGSNCSYLATPSFSCPSGGTPGGNPYGSQCIVATCTPSCPTTCGGGGESNSCGGTCSARAACSCSATSWTPDPALTCQGTNLTQTSNCNTTQIVGGTGYCPPPTCNPNPVKANCAANTCQGSYCSDDCTTYAGTKVCTATVRLDITSDPDSTVISNDGKINCMAGGGTCWADYSTGQVVTLNGSATSPHTLSSTSWTGCNSATANQCSVTMNIAKTIDIKSNCLSDNTCAADTCSNKTCNDICGNSHTGTKTCSTRAATPWKEVAP
jgi:hypothetical protein